MILCQWVRRWRRVLRVGGAPSLSSHASGLLSPTPLKTITDWLADLLREEWAACRTFCGAGTAAGRVSTSDALPSAAAGRSHTSATAQLPPLGAVQLRGGADASSAAASQLRRPH